MDGSVEYLVLGLVVLLALLLACYYKVNVTIDGFGVDNKPFEPENTLLHRNPWDDIDYVVPVFNTRMGGL